MKPDKKPKDAGKKTSPQKPAVTAKKPVPSVQSAKLAKRVTPASAGAAPKTTKKSQPQGPIAKATAVPKLSAATVKPAREAVAAKASLGKPKGVAARPPAAGAQKRFAIPPILLEGDLPPAPKVTGPGVRYALGPEPAGSRFPETGGELPEGYGTRRLFLTARDPHWLYASWDLMDQQQRDYNSRSRDGHLILRVFANDESAFAVPEAHVNPESRSWFINVPRAETRYRAELGLYDKAGVWESASRSQTTFTPPDAPSSDVAAEFATIPVEITFKQVVEMVQEFVTEHQPLLEAVIAAQGAQKNAENAHVADNSLPVSVSAGSPPSVASSAPARLPIHIEAGEAWTPEQMQALTELITVDAYRRVWMGSIEITELVRRQLQEEVSSIAAADKARAAEAQAEAAFGGVPGISSPAGGETPRDRKFWFKINAELIVYGSTEPDARVTIADRSVKLRPDGSFSFRFALPDGRYELPALAISNDGAEGRLAALEFSRSTEYRGHVEPHPQDASLRPPGSENL